MNSDKRFIEESFPVKEVSAESAKEKHIRHGHISTLHIWWARRPLASSRATNYAALIPAVDPEKNLDEWNKTKNFIIDLCKWENSLNTELIKKAREDILKANGGKSPKVLDPFSGGGSIPLEALRLGCETYASDYNPVATLILKCTLEYPQKYGKPVKAKSNDWTGAENTVNPLLEDVKKWGNWVLEEAKKEIGQFYPLEPDGSIPVGYIWARTIHCQNPACGAEIPLMRQFWLAKKDKKKISLYPYVVGKVVQFKVVGSGNEIMPDDFDPEEGTVSRAVVICPVCGATMDANTTRRLFREGKSGQRMVSVVTRKSGIDGKNYRIANKKDVQIFLQAEGHLKEKREKLTLEWGMDPLPDESLPPKGSHRAVGSQLPLYNFKTWGDLFNSRQKLTLITITEKLRSVYNEMTLNGLSAEYNKAVVSYLALESDMTAAFTNTLARWENTSEAIKQLYSRQALPMLWDYAEVNPLSESTGSFKTGQEYYQHVIEHCSMLGSTIANIKQTSATSLPYADNYFDAIFTDPPYYDNVPYSYLSDFFYVWMKRTIGDLYPDLFSTPLTPKKDEIVVYDNLPGGRAEAKIFFEDMLKKAFQEIFRVLKPNGISTIVYAHKSTSGWETLINSLLDSGLIVTGAWPLNTEMRGRLNADETAALASSIYIVARKTERQPAGFYNNVQDELKKYLNQKLDRLWKEGIGGADFFIAAIGSGIEVFGKYEKVIDYEGNIIRAARLLSDVRKIATDYAVHQILHNGFAGEISDLTRFYVLSRWNFGEAKVEFDEAQKLARSCSIDLAREWNRGGFIQKDKEFIRVLGPEGRTLEELEGKTELIDVLHATLLLWEKSRRNDMLNLLANSGYGAKESFYRVAQAVSETLPIDSKEKKLLEGFLAGREHTRKETRERTTMQRRLL